MRGPYHTGPWNPRSMFGLYPESKGKPLRGSGWGMDVIEIEFPKTDLCDHCVEDQLERDRLGAHSG